MTIQEVGIYSFIGVVIVALVLLLIRILISLRKLNASFAKLGFLVREDAKKYFDEAADKIVDTNQQFQESYQKIVEDGTRTVVGESSAVVEKTLMSAHADANKIIINARTDAQQIIQGAHKEADDYAEKTLLRTADAVQWVLSQYMGETFSVKQHEELIEKQIRMYIDEHRQ